MDNSEEECIVGTSQDEICCISEMVKAILILDHSKKPFKECDIYRLLNKKYSSKLRKTVFGKVQEKLKEIGVTLMQTKNTNSKTYFLVSNFFPLPEMHQYGNDREIADRILLVLILTFLMMKQKPVELGDILNHLKMFKIQTENSATHEYFGNIEKKISIDFVSQMYLEKINANGSDIIKYQWGERAEAEVSKKSLLEFVYNIGYNVTIQPETLISHYQFILEKETTKEINE